MNYPNSRYFLLTCLFITACTRFLVSDTILPEQVIQVVPEHILYDGRSIIFLPTLNNQKEIPSSISGRKKYTYDNLSEQTGKVEGEYLLTGGVYFIIRLENEKLIKIPSKDFLIVTNFIIDTSIVNDG